MTLAGCLVPDTLYEYYKLHAFLFSKKHVLDISTTYPLV